MLFTTISRTCMSVLDYPEFVRLMSRPDGHPVQRRPMSTASIYSCLDFLSIFDQQKPLTAHDDNASRLKAQFVEFRQCFNLFDSKRKCSTVSMGEWIDGLELLGLQKDLSLVDMETIYKEIGGDGVTYTDFVRMMVRPSGPLERVVQKCMREMREDSYMLITITDENGDGLMSRHELLRILTDVASEVHIPMVVFTTLIPNLIKVSEYKMLSRLVDEVDDDNDGSISFDEFVAMLTGKVTPQVTLTSNPDTHYNEGDTSPTAGQVKNPRDS